MLRWARRAEKIRMDDERTLNQVETAGQAFSLAAREIILGDMKVTSMMERSSIQIPDRYMINVRVYLRR